MQRRSLLFSSAPVFSVMTDSLLLWFILLLIQSSKIRKSRRRVLCIHEECDLQIVWMSSPLKIVAQKTDHEMGRQVVTFNFMVSWCDTSRLFSVCVNSASYSRASITVKITLTQLSIYSDSHLECVIAKLPDHIKWTSK